MLAHWELADGAAGPGGITVLGGVDRGQLGVWRGELAAVWVELVHHENSVEYGAELLRRLRVGGTMMSKRHMRSQRAWSRVSCTARMLFGVGGTVGTTGVDKTT